MNSVVACLDTFDAWWLGHELQQGHKFGPFASPNSECRPLPSRRCALVSRLSACFLERMRPSVLRTRQRLPRPIRLSSCLSWCSFQLSEHAPQPLKTKLNSSNTVAPVRQYRAAVSSPSVLRPRRPDGASVHHLACAVRRYSLHYSPHHRVVGRALAHLTTGATGPNLPLPVSRLPRRRCDVFKRRNKCNLSSPHLPRQRRECSWATASTRDLSR